MCVDGKLRPERPIILVDRLQRIGAYNKPWLGVGLLFAVKQRAHRCCSVGAFCCQHFIQTDASLAAAEE